MKTLLATPDKSRRKRWRALLEAMGFAVQELARLDHLESRVSPSEAALALIDCELLRGQGEPLKAVRARCPKLVVLAFGDDSAMYGQGVARALAAGAVDMLNDNTPDDNLERSLAPYLSQAAGKEETLLSPDKKLRVACGAREVSFLYRGKWKELTGLKPKEYELLCIFLKYPGTELRREHLMEKVWGGKGVNPEALDKQVGSLRKKLGTLGRAIKTIRGVGYTFK